MFAISVTSVSKAAASFTLALDVIKRFCRVTPDWMVGSAAEEMTAVLREVAGDAGFWPTPWLGGLLSGHVQTVWYGLNLDSPSYEFSVDTWRTEDGGTVGLAWPVAATALPEDAPVVLILPGLCGSIQGTGHTIRAMVQQGCRPCCLHARGCGQPLTSPCFNIFGSTEDLRVAVKHIAEKHPSTRGTCLHSISAGTGLMVRYLGEEGERAPILAACANSPGYDIGVCLKRVGYLYDSKFYIGVLKKHWLEGANGAVLRAAAPDVCRRMADAPDMHSFMVAAAPFAQPPSQKGGTYEIDPGTIANAFGTFLLKSNPMGTAHRIQVPQLILNADDDPICDWRNTEENSQGLLHGTNCPRTVLLRFSQGGHCCFARGLRAHRWGDELSARFLAGVARKVSM